MPKRAFLAVHEALSMTFLTCPGKVLHALQALSAAGSASAAGASSVSDATTTAAQVRLTAHCRATAELHHGHHLPLCILLVAMCSSLEGAYLSGQLAA